MSLCKEVWATIVLSQLLYSSTCHERTPSGPGNCVRTLQVVARRRDGWAAPNVIHLARLHSSPPALFILNTMSCIVIIMYAIVIEPKINAS